MWKIGRPTSFRALSTRTEFQSVPCCDEPRGKKQLHTAGPSHHRTAHRGEVTERTQFGVLWKGGGSEVTTAQTAEPFGLADPLRAPSEATKTTNAYQRNIQFMSCTLLLPTFTFGFIYYLELMA